VPKKKTKLPLSKTHPKLAKEADGWDPKTVLSGSDTKRNWICKQSHKWTASPNSRTSKKITGCPVCSNHKLEFGTNDLFTFDKKIASEAFGWDPRQVAKFSGKKVNWICTKGHTWEARVYSRTRNRTGCPVCRNLKILVGTNDLATTHPTLAKQAYGWDPTKIVSGTKKRLAWKCEIGHTWSSNVELRTKQKTGCPFCTNQKTLSGFNDLATTHPKLALEALGWNPEKFTAGSAQRVKWKCSFNHIWVSSVRSRGFKNTGCPTCMGRITLKGFNDLATKYPAIAREAFGWDPTKISPGSRIKKKWMCEYGHTWTALVANRVHLARGCPSCSKTGFDPNKTGWLYLLEHNDWGMLQIGISNVPEMRVKEHSSLGWELLDIRGPMDGLSAQNLETNLLASLFKKGADLSNSKIAGKFDGYSEAWSKSTFPVKSIKELMRLTEEFEENKK
jgi:hypothetical protein